MTNSLSLPACIRRVCGDVARIALAALLCVLMAACTPESRNRLPDKDRITPDSRLIGQWHGVIDGADYLIDITQADPLTVYVALTETLPVGDKPVTKIGYAANMYAIGSRTIIAFHEIEPKPAYWRFAVLLFSGDDRASLVFMDEKFVRNEVFRSALAGIIRTDDPTFPDVLLTASSDDLATFIRGNDEAKVFDIPFGPFERRL